MSPGSEGFDFWLDGLERGRKMVDFLQEKIGPLHEKRILDVGCGLGGISIAFNEKSSCIFSLDRNEKIISRFKRRLSDKNIRGIYFLQADSSRLPFLNNSFDLVIINGVLEWVGHDKDEDPISSQLHTLSEAMRVLKKDGILYLAIENRFYPINFIRDPHLGIPFVTLLPYRLGYKLAYFLKGYYYTTPIHSYWWLKRMLKRIGFSRICIYAGLIHYQYPVVNINLDNKYPRFLQRGSISKIITSYRNFNLKRGLFLKVLFLRAIFLLGIDRLLVHSFIVLAQK